MKTLKSKKIQRINNRVFILVAHCENTKLQLHKHK